MHRKLAEQGPRDDAKLAKEIVGTFLYDLKVSLIAATQRGLARSMMAAGRPYRSLPNRSHRVEAVLTGSTSVT